MEAENGKTTKVYIRTDHPETERGRCSAQPGENGQGSVSAAGGTRTDLLPVAKGVWGDEHNPGEKAKRIGKRKSIEYYSINIMRNNRKFELVWEAN